MSDKKTKKKYDRTVKFNSEKERINWYKSIRKLFVEKKASRALPEIEEYMNMYPDDCYGKLLYGRILDVMHDHSKAREIFQELIYSEAKNMYSAMVDLGLLEKIQGNQSEAKKWFEKAINESHFDESIAKIYLAQLEYEDNDISKAIKLLKSVDSEYESFAKLELSKILFRSGNIKESHNVIYSIARTGNESFDRKVNLQKVKIDSSLNECDYEYMLLSIDNVLQGHKNKLYWNAVLEKAAILNKMGEFDEAIELCNKVINSNSNATNNIVADAFLKKGEIFESQKDYDQAKENYIKATDSFSKSKKAKAYFSLGMLQAYKTKEYESAIYNFEKVNSAKLYRRNALLNIVFINIRQKDFNRALKNLNILLDEKLFSDNCDEYRKLRIIIDRGLNVALTINKYNSYVEKQYANYSDEAAKKHIKERHIKNKDSACFYDFIDIDDLFETIKLSLTDENLESINFTDNYCIDYDHVGYDIYGNETNCIRVITAPNTKDIITMYPITKNTDTKVQHKPKVKRLSQIEKFNKRYNLK